ncbi:S41 family peptidase [Winogradskyella alexanderae]|uniref:S41 family peptidase n=1 Tax=Winogradskyella alexanderae TaxID=2877123 RepID=A0ABS7XQM4_9FLAO|nr:S41 family peptidase [Winogradskyella alexanderae]MCA0131709.1 S41 family peptidase [Winogradskyella alexanderae]
MKTLFTFLLSVLVLTQLINDDKKVQRSEMLDKVFLTLEENIANPYWLLDKSFLEFKALLYSDSILSLNDQEFQRTFDQARWNLPFTHFQIVKTKATSSLPKNKTENDNNPTVTWEAIDEKTAFLKIKTFSIPGIKVAKTLQEIGTDNYANLIIDLRDNGGGNLEGPIALGRFLTQKPIDAGYYLTRKWFINHDHLPTTEDVQQIPFLQDFSYAGIKKMFANEEAFRMVIPGHKNTVYQGNVYVLINKWTASACEPLIDIFKKNNIATLVGETSCGGMLSGSYFDINEEYKAFIPIADYYTAQGQKIDKIGVKPDIEINPADAKEYILQLIK